MAEPLPVETSGYLSLRRPLAKRTWQEIPLSLHAGAPYAKADAQPLRTASSRI